MLDAGCRCSDDPPVPPRNHYIFVCTNRRPDDDPRGSCAARGSLQLFAALKSEIARAGLAKVEARCCQSSCLDHCAEGPIVLLEPEHVVYKHVTLGDVADIVEALRVGSRVDRLVAKSASSGGNEESG